MRESPHHDDTPLDRFRRGGSTSRSAATRERAAALGECAIEKVAPLECA
jgi:hypothetical protein